MLGTVAGADLGERFEVQEVLGRGAYGTVFSAWDRAVGERVALKRLDRLDGPSRVRFKREFRALASVRHRGLVSLYELHALGATYGFSMERVEGRPLVEALRVSGDRAGVLARLAEALVALHEEGWLHNDLKPANALVTDAGRVVLLDFGLVSPREATGPRAGTLAYMAPEAEPSPASDWYALGTMLFEALAGRLPHEGSGRHLLMRKRQVDAPPLRSVAPDADPTWAELVDGLLARDPEARLDGLHARLEGVVGARFEPTRASPRFVGREDELRAIRAALDATRESVVVEVRGPSGIGKSTLLTRVAREDPGGATLRVGCSPQENLSSAALDALVDALVEQLEDPAADVLAPDPEAWRALATAFPQLGEPPDAAEIEPARARTAAARGLARLLGRLGERPLVVVDDAQWLDADSGELLRAIAARTPLALLLATRSDLDSSGPAFTPDRTVDLAPLAPAQVRELVGDALYDRLDGDAWASADGRPYLLLELARITKAGADRDPPATRWGSASRG